MMTQVKGEAGEGAGTVLVTGGAGYVGSHACKALAAAGFRPVVYDNLVTGHPFAVKWGPFEHGDVLDRSRLDEVIARHRPRAILHFAAFAYVRESMADPGRYWRNNVQGSLTLLEAARDAGVRDIVFSSSCAVFGIPAATPIGEDAPRAPISPYGATKLTVETMLQDFGRAHGTRWVALRYFNAAGCDPDGEIGELHDPETHLIPLALEVAAGERPRLTVFGADHPTPDGTCVRDYVHVADLARAHVAALQRLEAGMASAAFNLGVGRGYSVREVIETVRAVTGAETPFTVAPRQAGDPPILIADPTRAAGALGWAPQLPELSDIVRTAWNWRGAKQDARQCVLA
ncbi:UDP-glucose 4-epimerase GalE [Phenylobacterium soli]|nr:UDP-glucose 4-epimerase GalE [Phenylobacterium soli]